MQALYWITLSICLDLYPKRTTTYHSRHLCWSRSENLNSSLGKVIVKLFHNRFSRWVAEHQNTNIIIILIENKPLIFFMTFFMFSMIKIHREDKVNIWQRLLNEDSVTQWTIFVRAPGYLYAGPIVFVCLLTRWNIFDCTILVIQFVNVNNFCNSCGHYFSWCK